MDIKGNKYGFYYEAFRQETIAYMLAGGKGLTGEDGLQAPLLKYLLTSVKVLFDFYHG